MPEEPTEIGEFIFGIIAVQHTDGKTEHQTNIINKNVPIEIIAMQLKAFLANVEQDYFGKFNETVGFFREE